MSWDQLAAAVRARRKELGLKQVDVAAAGHVSVDLIRNIEHLRRTPKRVNPRTARAIEDALAWEPGSVVAIVAGGEPTPITKSRSAEEQLQNELTATGENPAPDTHAGSSPPVISAHAAHSAEAPGRPENGDRFALARQILALRSALSEHQRAISPEAREALMTEVANSAREAEETIVRIMPWLDEGERGEAIQLLVKLREPLA